MVKNKHSKKILIVEDNRIALLDLQKLIENMGYNVIATASSGENAIELAFEHKPDLIIMDIMLEGKINGIEAAQKICTEIDIPIIYATAYTDEKTIENAKSTYPYGYLTKPIEVQDLHVTLTLAFSRHEFKSKLEASERRYKSLFDESQDAIYILDTNGIFLDFNKSMLDLFNFTESELYNIPLKKLFLDKNNYNTFIETINKQGHIKDFQVKLQKKDKTEIFCMASSNTLNSTNNIITGFQGIIKDIDKMQRAMNGIIQAMVLTVEARDPYTAGHQRRVANLAYVIALELGLPLFTANAVKMAGIIHDLGKIQIPSEILSKPGKITAAELSIIKSHPQVAYDILKEIDFPWPLAKIILEHHEKLNGSGYPYGLTKKEILIESKILAVADAFEAMSSHRPYRPALGIDYALKEISKKKGIHYDKDVVSACIEIIKNKKFDINNY